MTSSVDVTLSRDKLYIGGAWVAPASAESIPVENPATEEILGHVPAGTAADVDAVYEQLLSPAKRAYFDYWEQRLHEELGSPDDRQSIDLIDVIAKNPEGESVATLKSALGKHLQDGAQRDDKLRYLLDVLQADGYIVETGGRFLFRSSLLRDFWLRRVSL